MRLSDIEYWALNVIHRVEAGQPNEDSRVEMKSKWPDDPWRAAWLIGGHANAAGGDPILWLIGVNQKSGFVGTLHEEFSTWYAQVSSHFSELAPKVTDVNIPYKGGTVVALLFTTDRAPFVIKSNTGGVIQRGVPWRENTSTLSADRSDLIQLLMPHALIPSFQVLKGLLTADRHRRDRDVTWQLELTLYVRPASEGRIVIPFHECSCRIDIPEIGPVEVSGMRMVAPAHMGVRIINEREGNLHKPSGTAIDSTADELIISGPGKIHLFASMKDIEPPAISDQEVTVTLTMHVIDATIPAVVNVQLRRVSLDAWDPNDHTGTRKGVDPPEREAKWVI